MTRTIGEFETCGCLPHVDLKEEVIDTSPLIPSHKALQDTKRFEILQVHSEPVIVPLKSVRWETYSQYYAKLRDRIRRRH
jgi:hypothetical protein